MFTYYFHFHQPDLSEAQTRLGPRRTQRSPRKAGLTLQWEDGVPVDHDAQLQDELGGGLQEGFQEAEHGDVSALEHQLPVEVVPGSGAVPAALSAQVEGVDVSEDQRQKEGWSRMLTMLNAGTERAQRKHSEATLPV